jgi:nucleotide-binding universal stress UspA family protein
MFKTILLCSDGSDHARQAAQTAAEMTARYAANLILLNVCDPSPATAPFMEMTESYIEETQRTVLKCTSRVLKETGVTFRTRRELGHPVAKIISTAESEKADLIVLGSRGLSPWKALLLGSVSEGVVHHAHCPVLIVRGPQKPFHHILLASDGSAGAQRAAVTAKALAKQFEAALTVLNVYEPPGLFSVVGGMNPNPIKALEEQMEAQQQLTQTQESLREIITEDDLAHIVHQKRGHPAETIVWFAEEYCCDLIVMGSRGLGTFQALLLGSVADKVVRQAHCPVLIVR